MNSKIYKFSYGNNLKKALSVLGFIIYNFIVGIFILFFIGLLISQINYKLECFINTNTMSIIKSFEIYASIIFLVLFVFQALLPQKVIIDNEMIKIKRHCLFFSPLMIFRGLNDTILINKIADIYRPISKDKFFQPIPVNAIDWDNMIIIKINNSTETEYYVPVENSEEFIKQVKLLMEESK